MRDQNATALLARVMGWGDQATIAKHVPQLQLLADYKYNRYQRFHPGGQFIESLALWLNQFQSADRSAALELVIKHLVFFSEAELAHLVQTVYPDVIVQERIALVAQEQGIPDFRVGTIAQHRRFEELRVKSLYLGLSDGARTSELRRASSGEISNEQIWQAYELSEEKAEDMLKELRTALAADNLSGDQAKFTLVWLLDDFTGSGNTYIRYDPKTDTFKGKIKKIYERLHRGDLVDTEHYEVYLLIYLATRKAVDHIEYWSERFTSRFGYKPLQLRVVCTLEPDIALTANTSAELKSFLEKAQYYDSRATDRHILVGGTSDARLGFAGCALPVVLSHNTPNNSIYLLWGSESFKPFGLFPRVSRHREF